MLYQGRPGAMVSRFPDKVCIGPRRRARMCRAHHVAIAPHSHQSFIPSCAASRKHDESHTRLFEQKGPAIAMALALDRASVNAHTTSHLGCVFRIGNLPIEWKRRYKLTLRESLMNSFRIRPPALALLLGLLAVITLILVL